MISVSDDTSITASLLILIFAVSTAPRKPAQKPSVKPLTKNQRKKLKKKLKKQQEREKEREAGDDGQNRAVHMEVTENGDKSPPVSPSSMVDSGVPVTVNGGTVSTTAEPTTEKVTGLSGSVPGKQSCL